MGVCLIADAKDKTIQEYILDEQTVYAIPVSINRVTTISFPGPISAIDAAQVTIDPQKPAAFLIAHTKGSSFLSVRAEAKKATTNVNIRWNNKTYVIELVESDEPLLSVTFQNRAGRFRIGASRAGDAIALARAAGQGQSLSASEGIPL